MPRIADLQNQLRAGKAMRRPHYPEGRVVWVRRDGLLAMIGPQGRIQAKPFLLDDLLADDWTLVEGDPFYVPAPQSIMAKALGVDPLVPLRDFSALFVSGLVVVILVWLLTTFWGP